MPDVDELLYWVGIAAVAILAVAGVLDAARKDMDLVGAITIGTTAALGGGTVRDILLDRTVFWLVDSMYLPVAVLTSIIGFFIVRRRHLPPRLFLLPDALGLALFTIIGTQLALHAEVHWLAASLLGVITGVVGGVLRDVLCNEVPLIFVRGQLYATAAWLGAVALIGLQALGVSGVSAAWSGMALIFVVRVLAIIFQVTLPTLRDER